MNVDVFQLVVPFAAGIVLGLIYFGGLWLTVRDVYRVRHPVLLLFCSFVVRLAVVLVSFYLVMDGRWERIVFSLVGFFIVRQLLIHRILPVAVVQNPGTKIQP